MKSSLIRRIAGTLAIAVLAGSFIAGCDAKSAGEQSMKFVNIEKVIIDSGLAAQEKTHLQAVYQSLQQGAKLGEDSYKSLPQDKAAQARQADANVLNAQWQAEQRAARNAVAAQVAKAADQYRVAHKIDAIMPARSALSYSSDLDITADLVKQLKSEKVVFGNVPKVTQKSDAKPAEAAKTSK